MIRIIAPLISAIAIAGIAGGNDQPTVASVPADTLYMASTGDHIATLDQNDGSITKLTPQPGFSFQTLAFDSTGRLFATGCTPSDLCPLLYPRPGPPVDIVLMELDPVTGAVLDTIGVVTDDSRSVLITALSVQPGTNFLYGLGLEYRDGGYRDPPPAVDDRQVYSHSHPHLRNTRRVRGGKLQSVGSQPRLCSRWHALSHFRALLI